VQLDIFETITIGFLMVGHTHDDIDRYAPLCRLGGVRHIVGG
jgi:hypothetical protein